jgi:hypothetical protein
VAAASSFAKVPLESMEHLLRVANFLLSNRALTTKHFHAMQTESANSPSQQLRTIKSPENYILKKYFSSFSSCCLHVRDIERFHRRHLKLRFSDPIGPANDNHCPTNCEQHFPSIATPSKQILLFTGFCKKEQHIHFGRLTSVCATQTRYHENVWAGSCSLPWTLHLVSSCD